MVDWKRIVGVSLGVGLCVGCTKPHVPLNAPSSSAPPQERLSAYDQLRPLSMHETHTTYYQGGVEIGASRTTDYVQLASGQRVYHATDLLQVVPPNSPTANAANEAESNASTASTLGWVSGGMLVGGAALMMMPLFTTEPGEDMNMTPLIVGGGVMVLSTVPLLIGMGFARDAQDEKATAFETYDDGLRRQLNLCVRNQVVVPCE